MTPASIDTVVMYGRILKRGGKLVHLSRDAILLDARQALEDTLRRPGRR